MDRKIIIGTRGSDLALWQANHVQAQLKKLGVEATLHIIKTTGDKIQDIGFDKMEGKGFFTKEIEEALLKKEIDLAVHSHKDLETNQPKGLTIASVSDRENPAELLIIRKEAVDIKLKYSLKTKAVVGTSSARRKSQLLEFRDDIELKDLRGNVPTRIQKLKDAQYDAIMIAVAGVSRLKIDLSEFYVEELDPREFISAPAQGVLGLQIREEDKDLFNILQKLNHKPIQDRIAIERGVLNKFKGGCQIPLGVYVEKHDGVFHVWASVAKTWDSYPKRVYLTGTDRVDLINQTVEKLQERNAGTSVLISRKLSKHSFFKTALEKNGFNTFGVPFTSFSKEVFTELPQTDWVFFSSRNCVKYFLNQHPVLHKKIKFGSIGGATEAEVRKFGYTSTFIGSSTDTTQIGNDFASVVGGESVLFPQSSSSYRTVQKQFKDQSNLHELVTYNSLDNKDAVVVDSDVVVLTSPTNAILYFRKGGKKEGKTFIAMGNSTGKTLEENGITDYLLPWNSSELALVDTILSL